jgi:hypothetical protein
MAKSKLEEKYFNFNHIAYVRIVARFLQVQLVCGFYECAFTFGTFGGL